MTQEIENVLQKAAGCFKTARTSLKEGNELLFEHSKKENWVPFHHRHRTYEGVLRGLWFGMWNRTRHDKNYKNVKLLMTRKEFEHFCSLREIELRQMYDLWIRTDYDKDYSLSVDRIDPKKDYSLDNIQFLHMKENRYKQWDDYRERIGVTEWTKQCSVCRVVKSKKEFTFSKKNPDGFDYYCKPCKVIKNKKRYG